MAGNENQSLDFVPMYGKGLEKRKSPDTKVDDSEVKKGADAVGKSPEELKDFMKQNEPLPSNIIGPEGGKVVGGGAAVDFDTGKMIGPNSAAKEGAIAEGGVNKPNAESGATAPTGTSDGKSGSEGQSASSSSEGTESASGEQFKTKEELLQKYPNFDSLLKAAKSGRVDGNNLLDMYKKIAPCNESEARVFNDAFDLIKSGKVVSNSQERSTIFRAERRLNFVYDKIASSKK